MVNNTAIKILNLSKNQITDQSAYDLKNLLVENSFLQELYLHWNNLQSDGGVIIAEGLLENSSIKVIDISYNSLGSNKLLQSGKQLILSTGHGYSCLKHMDLRNNNYSIEEVKQMQEVLKKNHTLFGFHIEGNNGAYIDEFGYIQIQSQVSNQDFYNQQFNKMQQMVSPLISNMSSPKNQNQVLAFNKQQKYNKESQVKINLKRTEISEQNQNIKQQQKKIKMQLNQNQVLKNIQPRINGLKCIEKSNENQNHNIKQDTCWICQGWQEKKFEFNLKKYKNLKQGPIYLHCDFDGYQAFQMTQVGDDINQFVAARIVPRKNIYYFFSNKDEFIDIRPDAEYMESQIILKQQNCYQMTETPQNSVMVENINNKNVQQQHFQPFQMQKIILKYQYEDHTDQLILPFPELVNIERKQYQEEINNYQMGIQEDENIKKQFLNSVKGLFAGIYSEPIVESIPRPIKVQQKQEVLQISKKKKWSMQQDAIFKEYQKNYNEIIVDCFEFDWECSKIPSQIKNEMDKIELKRIFKNIYNKLIYAYKYYAGVGAVGEIFSVPSNTFNDFINGTGIVDGQLLKVSDIDFNFIATNSSTKYKNSRNPDRALIRYQFMEILIRIAKDKYKYIKNNITDRYAVAVSHILNKGILNKIEQFPNPQKWRDEKYWNEECDKILRKKKSFLEQIFNSFSGKRPRKEFQKIKTLSILEFRDIFTQYKIFDEKKFLEKDANVAFNMSVQQQLDELSSDKHCQMIFIEFLEAIARCADKYNIISLDPREQDILTPEQVAKVHLEIKLENFIQFIYVRQQQFEAQKGGKKKQKDQNLDQNKENKDLTDRSGDTTRRSIFTQIKKENKFNSNFKQAYQTYVEQNYSEEESDQNQQDLNSVLSEYSIENEELNDSFKNSNNNNINNSYQEDDLENIINLQKSKSSQKLKRKSKLVNNFKKKQENRFSLKEFLNKQIIQNKIEKQNKFSFKNVNNFNLVDEQKSLNKFKLNQKEYFKKQLLNSIDK